MVGRRLGRSAGVLARVDSRHAEVQEGSEAAAGSSSGLQSSVFAHAGTLSGPQGHGGRVFLEYAWPVVCFVVFLMVALCGKTPAFLSVPAVVCLASGLCLKYQSFQVCFGERPSACEVTVDLHEPC